MARTDGPEVPGRVGGPTQDDSGFTSILSQPACLDELKAYHRFLFQHCVALVPTLIALVVAFCVSFQARTTCNLQTIDRNHKATHASLSCHQLLDIQTIALCSCLGVTAWLASYASRRASWSFASSLVFVGALTHSPDRRRPASADPQRFIVGIAVLLQSLLTESLRIFSFYLASCILLARLHEQLDEASRASPSLQSSRHHREPPPWAWQASFHDPRFFIAIWVSLAWSLIEFVSGASQILRQLALYKPWQGSEAPFAFDASSAWSRVSFFRPGAAARDAELGEAASQPYAQRIKALAVSRSSTWTAPSAGTITPGKAAMRTDGPGTSQAVADQAQRRNYGTMSGPQVARPDNAEARSRAPTSGPGGQHISEAEQASTSSFTTSSTASSELDMELEDQVQQLLLAKERAEVEAVLGAPLPSISVALCSLWRIDAMLWSMGSGLLLSAIFAHSQGSLGDLTKRGFSISVGFNLFPSLPEYAGTFGFLVLLHAAVSVVWATSLPTIGFASATYSSLLIGISLLLAGLARWGFLV
ncbi:uncharacterized protein PFL1_06942 [Pseudozyma flocculosa PF-1]|uniref:Uncharacterized protein n=2 Tax=Pseudozyma flocculosa TaxID=84751 RepID=A0A5C3F1M3_9BASI|nr:uncharacterized protein PFL1_06942 [Pseudozyma flocculosa PF-1]EPQ29436.1 hypothetical protein PFL1_06942 [Pseudozyma flocculosa PF-1]SPO37960.1 uncharacterized protein PSFLO_03437 [Pseudozyma flocculosa]